MAVIVEDGSQVTGSNSYISRADYITYAGSIGVTIADSETADYQLIKAAEYIDSHETNLKGTRYERDQSMAYPRTDLEIEGFYWSNTEIPTKVIACQIQYALDINSGDDLFNRSNNPNQLVKKEKVDGAVEIEYAVNNTSASGTYKTSKGDILLDSLLKNSGNVIGLIRA